MWESIRIASNEYIIKKICKNGNYTLLISDFIKLWSEELSSTILCERCKKFNPLVEGEQDSLNEWIFSTLSNESSANLKLTECDEAQVLELNSKLAGVPFTFKFYLKLETAEKFHSELTLPLLLMVQRLQSQKNKLFDLLKKKDVEISEYKMEGAKLSRKNIETATFKEKEFEDTCKSVDVPREELDQPARLFSLQMLDLYRDVVHRYQVTATRARASEITAAVKDTAVEDSSPEKKRKLNEPRAQAVEHQQETDNGERSSDEPKVKAKKVNEAEEHRRREEEKMRARQKKLEMKKKRLPL